MTKDDYETIVYKILLYYYARMKRVILFDRDVYYATIEKDKINQEYLTDIYVMMQDEGLIEGVKYVKAWGNDKILTSEEADISITSAGIRYLKENSAMARAKEFLLENVTLASELLKIMHI